jgi:mannan endo-1,6-alpha-mannosidase
MLVTQVSCIWLNPDSLTELQSVTGLIADGTLDYLDYSKGIGLLADPYYWWHAGGMWGSMVDYWFFMENDTYVNLTTDALLAQVGDNNDYVPLNQSTTEGNDDQAFWGLAVMQAAERNFPNPPEDQPQWLYLAQSVFNTMAARWDEDTCGGGLRWQIFKWNSGYDYKNSVSNGCLFNIAARLARYTGNDSYVDWADKIHDWLYDVGLIAESEYYFVYDGVQVDNNCSTITKLQWTYNQGLLMSGSAFLYNYTSEEKWRNRTLRYLQSSSVFFNNSIMYEAACQNSGNCNNDQRTFKAYFSRFLGSTAQMVPETNETIYALLDASARGASSSCSGGTDGHTCGLNWFKDGGGWDGYYGLGEQMSALEVMQNLRIRDRPAPYTAETGGTSVGDPAAGTETTQTNLSSLQLDGGDTAGAAIITAVVSLSIIASVVWILL